MRWLHISDVHYNPDMDGRSSAQLREQLPDYLSKLGICVDEVFITGDFRFARNQDDTDEVASSSVAFVRELAKSAGVVDPDHIHIVPGNHDLVRYKDAADKRKLSGIIKSYSYEGGQFSYDDMDFLLKRFSFFKRVCSKLYSESSVWADNLQPIHTYRCFGSYSLLYLNTAIVCNKDEERGELILGNNALYLALKSIKAQNGNKPIIVLAHHALEYLSKREREIVEVLFRDYSVSLYLCGDAHEVWHRWINETLEITMGCIKLESGMQAAFSIGEMSPDGYITVNTHSWDYRIGGWGPYIQFNQTIKETLPKPSANAFEMQLPYYIDARVVGRDAIIDDVFQKLQISAGEHAVEVQGPPGIGKTTVCRAAMVCFKSSWVTEVDMTQRFTKTDALSAILTAFGVEQPEALEKQMENLIKRYPRYVVYFDNMEDPLGDVNYSKWFLDFISKSGWHILYSSRKRIHSHKIKSISIPPLGLIDAKSMFLSLWGEMPCADLEILEKLLEVLDYHPLTIKLVTAQKYKYPSVKSLLDAWKKNKDYHSDMAFEDDEGPHRSLYTAVKMSYDAVAHNHEPLIVWGVLSFIPSVLSRELFEMIFQDDLRVYEEAANILLKNGLIDAVHLRETDGYGYSMLNPIKSQAFAFDEADRETSATLLRNALTAIFKAGDKRDGLNRGYWHDFSLRCVLPALTFLDKVLLDEGRNKPLLLSMNNYFQYSTSMSLELLQKLKIYQNDRYFSAFLNEYIGDLERRLGEIEAAQRHYGQAEELYRSERDNLGLANVLQSMGDLESRLGEIEAAQRHYGQAEELYRSERANLGLANVLKSMGDLERQQKKYVLSLDHYEKALSLYETAQAPMGKGYTMGELCRIYALMEKKSEALQWIERTMNHLSQMPENVRPYVMACIKESFGWLGIDDT